MGTPPDDKKSYEIVDLVKSWIPRRSEPSTMSRDFWMPDNSCWVCYECDAQFNVFNRKHHCRICGRVFCAKCTANTIPAPSDEQKSGRENVDRVRVCNYCFKHWKERSAGDGNARITPSTGLSMSPSSSSLISNQSSCSGSSGGSAQYSTGSFQHVSCGVGENPCQSAQMDTGFIKQDTPGDYSDARDTFSDHFGPYSRSDDEDDDYSVYRSHSAPTPSSPDFGYDIKYDQIDHGYKPHDEHSNDENIHPTCYSPLSHENFEAHRLENVTELGEQEERKNNIIQSEPPPLSVSDGADLGAVDYENDDLLWLPPEPEDKEDENEALLSDDDDDVGGDVPGEWGYSRTSSFGGPEYRNRDKSNEEHRKAMKRVVDGHFRSLIAQLLQAENLPIVESNTHESWLDIITSLSWEAATILKPDTSVGGGMDPGGYVKVKCIASGCLNESVVVKGVVCKKNVAHRRMTSKIDKARLLLLGGALEYQRVSNHLSSVQTLLQQEMDHLKMAVAKIDAHHPNVLLVEKSVSRYAQEYLLAKDISLVLNVKRPLLERIARCTGAQIIPSIDNLSSPKLGHCDSFHVEKFMENIGNAGKDGKKITKTLMFFEGCPRPLGCTILLKGASCDELKKVKHVVHYGVFAAYHLALETSFLADEGASLPEVPLTSPIKVALPDKPSNVARSISMVPGYTFPSSEKSQGPQQAGDPYGSKNDMFRHVTSSEALSTLSKGSSDYHSAVNSTKYDTLAGHPGEHYSKENNGLTLNECCVTNTSTYVNEVPGSDHRDSKYSSEGHKPTSVIENSELVSVGQNNVDLSGEFGALKEDFPPSPSDHQSILVSLSTRCVWKGSVCERAHLFRIKYYGSFDKPLGRFLWDHLFDQGYKCRSCESPSEAHIHCYTHRQGSLTISVKKFPEPVLPGEREGKIWMWHRCLKCPRPDGFPPATKRVVMSDAAWGLSFGKFLELSFSNHAAASRVATCGHSLHRDCLRFYGLGRMVACFRYAPINVHSVYLPPPKLEFDYYKQDWIQQEIEEVRRRADLLFSEVFKVLHQISEKIANKALKAPESDNLIAELELMLQKEKKEYEGSFWCLLNREVKSGQPAIDILEINRVRRQLAYHAYVWDQRLIRVNRTITQNSSSSVTKEKSVNYVEKKGKSVDSGEKRDEMEGRGFGSWDSSLVNVKPDLALSEMGHSQISSPNGIHKAAGKNQDLGNRQSTDNWHSSSTTLSSPSVKKNAGKIVRRALSEGQFPVMENLSDDLDAAWTGNQQPATLFCKEESFACPPILPEESDSSMISPMLHPASGNCMNDKFVAKRTHPSGAPLEAKGPVDIENPNSWLSIPFSVLYHSFNKNYSANTLKLGKIAEYNPVYVSLFKELVNQNGARLLLPVASADTFVPIYDDEPTSIISYSLLTTDYQKFMSEEPERKKDSLGSSSSLSILDSVNFLSFHFSDEPPLESLGSFGSVDETILSSGSRSFSGSDPLLSPSAMHARVSFSDDGPPGKVKYSVTCYFAKQFEALRRTCCASELDFIRSLSRCKKWGAQGGKSNVFFAKTLDDRFIIKQVTKTELESFMQFAPSYFKYLSESINSGCPTSLAKILGIYQVTSKHLKGGKESRMDVLVMENLLFRRNITRLYDLKGSARSRYNPDSSGSNKVLLDQNLLEAMPTSPIFLGTKAKRLLERAVWNDTSFLASIDVMDYSLLVGVDEEKHELVLGIIDFMRQYTWDKHLETWVKASGILGGPKNASPTVISPQQYKKRFRKAMSAYFLMVPDQWPSSMILPPGSQSEPSEENSQARISTQ